MFEVLRMSLDFDCPTELQLLTRLLTLITQTYLTAVCGTLTETSGVHQIFYIPYISFSNMYENTYFKDSLTSKGNCKHNMSHDILIRKLILVTIFF